MPKRKFAPTPAQEAVLRDESLHTKEAARRASVPFATAHQWCVANGVPTAGRGPQKPAPNPAKPAGHVAHAPHDEDSYAGDKWEATRVVARRVVSLEDLLGVCKADADVWDVERWSVKSWEGFVKNADERPEIVPTMYAVRATFKRKPRVIAGAIEQVRTMIAEAAGYMPRYRTIPFRSQRGGSLLLVSLPDAHFGKLCWGLETGYADYDLDIAQKLYTDTLLALLEKATRRIDNIQKVLYVVGHDFINCDNVANMTTKGTPQTMDTRYAKVIQAAFNTLRETTETLSQVAPVEAVVVPGNHDFNTMFLLGLALQGWMLNNPHVVIDNSPNPKKYKEWGVNAFGFVHGNNRKRPGLPLRMATERPEMWARCWNREWQTGHLHTTKEEEFQGTIVRILPSLSGTDTYHDDNDYVNNLRRGVISVYHETDGYDTEMVRTVR